MTNFCMWFWILCSFLAHVATGHYFKIPSSGTNLARHSHLHGNIEKTVLVNEPRPLRPSVNQSAAKKHFSSVLFVVKYNYHVPFNRLMLHSLFWSNVFAHQLVVVPYNSTTLQAAREKIGISGVEAISCLETDKFGLWAYSSLIAAMKLHPQFEGYLYAHDDMAFDVSKLMTLNLKSYWITDNSPGDAYNIPPTYLDSVWNLRNHSWYWWNEIIGIDAMQAALSAYPSLSQSLIRCTGTERRWFAGHSDFLYVPQHQKSIYIDNMSMFANSKVYLEIAVPTFLACFTPKVLIEKITLCVSFDANRGNVSYMARHCPPSSAAFHPVKLSGHNHFKFMMRKSGISFDNSSALLDLKRFEV